MSERGISPSLGSRMAARVEEMVDAAARDAAASAQRAEDERRELLAGAYEQAKDAFKEAAADARAAADERAARLAAMRRTIAERSELLIAEADVPDQVREQVEALLVALAETEAALAREAAVAAAP